MLTLLSLLILKHFICDFLLQTTPWMYKNKGIYGHVGGITHASIHAIGTSIVLICVGQPWYANIFLSTVDGVIHYHVDWAKVYINSYFKLTLVNSEWFWILLGVDQMMHMFTYVLIMCAIQH